MSKVSKEEWLDWKQHEITKALFNVCDIRVDDAKEILGASAGIDPVNDSFYRGFIAAYKEIRNVKLEDMEDD